MLMRGKGSRRCVALGWDGTVCHVDATSARNQWRWGMDAVQSTRSSARISASRIFAFSTHHLPRALSDLLMAVPSLSRAPRVSAAWVRSLPAKSIRLSLLRMSTPPGPPSPCDADVAPPSEPAPAVPASALVCVMWMVTTVWARLLDAFIVVAWMVRALEPASKRPSASEAVAAPSKRTPSTYAPVFGCCDCDEERMSG